MGWGFKIYVFFRNRFSRCIHSISYYRLLSVPFFPERYDKVKHVFMGWGFKIYVFFRNRFSRCIHSISYYRLLSVPFFPERYDKVKHGKAAMQESDAECRITAQKVTVSTARQCTLCRGETEPRPDSSGPSVSVIRSL